MVKWLALSLAAFAGAIMALQGSLNAGLSKQVGLWEMTFLVHVLGTLISLGIILTPLAGDQLANLFTVPWYFWLGGPAGVAIIYSVARSIPSVGVTAATTAIILAQLSTAALIDHLGLFGLEKIPFKMIKVLGIVLMGGGAWLLLMRPT